MQRVLGAFPPRDFEHSQSFNVAARRNLRSRKRWTKAKAVQPLTKKSGHRRGLPTERCAIPSHKRVSDRPCDSRKKYYSRSPSRVFLGQASAYLFLISLLMRQHSGGSSHKLQQNRASVFLAAHQEACNESSCVNDHWVQLHEFPKEECTSPVCWPSEAASSSCSHKYIVSLRSPAT